jgi:hypothetical protein
MEKGGSFFTSVESIGFHGKQTRRRNKLLLVLLPFKWTGFKDLKGFVDWGRFNTQTLAIVHTLYQRLN